MFLCYLYINFLSCEKAQAADHLKSKVESEGASVVDSPQVDDAGKQEDVSAVASDGNVCITSYLLFTLLPICLKLNKVLPFYSLEFDKVILLEYLHSYFYYYYFFSFCFFLFLLQI